MLTVRKSRNGQPRALANCCRKDSSDTPLSRQMNSSNESCDPLATAARHAFCHASNCSGVAKRAMANIFFNDTGDIQHPNKGSSLKLQPKLVKVSVSVKIYALK